MRWLGGFGGKAADRIPISFEKQRGIFFPILIEDLHVSHKTFPLRKRIQESVPKTES